MPDRRTEDEALAAMGLYRINPPRDEGFLVWPENEEAVTAFRCLATQWNYSDGRRRGLRFEAAESWMRVNGVRRRRQSGLLHELSVMEAAALEWLSERRASRG